MFIIYRFRLRVSVGDYDFESFFLLPDEVVKRLPPSTCKMLNEMVIFLVGFGL